MLRRAQTLLLLCLFALPAVAQPAADVNARIRAEGLERSQIMQTLHQLTDRFGPRLTGSPNLERAGAWALEQLQAWGLENAHAEGWDWGHPGWVNERLSAHLVAPVRDQLTCEVLAWTPGTDGPVVAEAVHLVPPEQPTQAALDAYFAEVRPGLDGKIALVGEAAVPELPAFFRNMKERRDDEEVAQEYEPDNPAQPRNYGRGGNDLPPDVLSAREVSRQVDAFVFESGAVLRVDAAGMDDGLIRAFANRSYDPAQALPTVVMRNEDFGRIARLLAGGTPVTLEFDIANRIYPENTTVYNYLAEIPGTDRADEVVMLGGHLDSWHAATGATDNAAGVAVMMEAVRILKALDLKPRRTIRIALWTGEEQGLLGSQAYVKEHFGSFEDPRPDYAKFGGYFNVDSGTGRLRGATVFGPTEAAQVLEDLLKPFADLGVAGARPSASRGLGGSDHTAFNAAGLPGVSLGQDPIRYFSHTWHTNLDTYERILEDDVKQAAVVVAALVYHLATREALLPRFAPSEMPQAPQGTY